MIASMMTGVGAVALQRCRQAFSLAAELGVSICHYSSKPDTLVNKNNSHNSQGTRTNREADDGYRTHHDSLPRSTALPETGFEGCL